MTLSTLAKIILFTIHVTNALLVSKLVWISLNPFNLPAVKGVDFYFSRKKIFIGTPVKSKFSRSLFSKYRR